MLKDVEIMVLSAIVLIVAEVAGGKQVWNCGFRNLLMRVALWITDTGNVILMCISLRYRDHMKI